MGVGGAAGLLSRKGHAWSDVIELRNTFLVIDLTSALFWFVKHQLLNVPHTSRMDVYGTSMVELGALYRRLFYRLLERNVTPIVVLDGGRKSEQRYGPLVSKSTFLQQSCSGALNNLNQCRQRKNPAKFYTRLPELANNALKEIIMELKLEYVVQSNYEVYPVLEHWAREKQCPVLTSHSDFIFYNCPKGFIWAEELKLPLDSKAPFTCRAYSHDRMLQQYQLEPGRSSALKTLSVLLRDDFFRAHHDAVNNILRIANTPMALRAHFIANKTRRLIYVMEECRHNTHFTTDQSVRSTLARQPNAFDANLLRDFDAIFDTYATYYANFADCEFSNLFSNRSPQRPGSDRRQAPSVSSSPSSPSSQPQSDPVTQDALLEALTQRETTAEFVGTLGAITHSRTGIEDTSVFRSTFSLHDNCRQYLLDNAMGAQFSVMRIFDRRRDSMIHRELNRYGITNMNRSTEPAGRLNRETLFKLFHFNSKQFESLADQLTNYGIDADNSNQLALQLLMARFACNLMYRDHYSNADDSLQILTNTRSDSLASSSSDGNHPAGQAGRKKKFLTAITNSYIHHARTSQGDQSNQDVPADIRVAREKTASIAKDLPHIQPGSNNQDEFYRMKHMIEALNSAIHGYKELNSLYGFPGPNIFVCKYYDGVLIYKIMSRWSANLQEYLIRLHDDIEMLLN